MSEANSKLPSPGSESAGKQVTSKEHCIASGVVSLILQAGLLFAFAFGLLIVYNRNLNPISAIEFVLDLFFFKWIRAQQYIVEIAVGVGYIAVLIFLIVKTIMACKTFSDMLHGSALFSSARALKIQHQTIQSFQIVMGFSCLVNSFTASDYTWWILLVMVLGALSYVFCRAMLRAQAEKQKSALIADCFGDLLAMTAVCLLYVLCAEPVGDKVFTGIGMLFGGYIGFGFGFKAFAYSFFCNLLEPVLNMVLTIVILKLISFFFDSRHEIFLKNLKKSYFKGIIFAGIVLALQFIFGTFFSFQSQHFSAEMLRSWLYTVTSFNLPVFLLLFAFWLLLGLVFPEYKKSAEQTL